MTSRLPTGREQFNGDVLHREARVRTRAVLYSRAVTSPVFDWIRQVLGYVRPRFSVPCSTPTSALILLSICRQAKTRITSRDGNLPVMKVNVFPIYQGAFVRSNVQSPVGSAYCSNLGPLARPALRRGSLTLRPIEIQPRAANRPPNCQRTVPPPTEGHCPVSDETSVTFHDLAMWRLPGLI